MARVTLSLTVNETLKWSHFGGYCVIIIIITPPTTIIKIYCMAQFPRSYRFNAPKSIDIMITNYRGYYNYIVTIIGTITFKSSGGDTVRLTDVKTVSQLLTRF